MMECIDVCALGEDLHFRAASHDLFAARRLFPGGSGDFGDQSRGSSPGLAACGAGRGDAGLHVPAVGRFPVPGDLEVLPPALSGRSRHVSQTQSVEKLSSPPEH